MASSSSFRIIVMVLQAIQIAFSPFVFTVVLRHWTVTYVVRSIDCHPALHVHFGAQLGQPLFRLIPSVTLGRGMENLMRRDGERGGNTRELLGTASASARLSGLALWIAY